MGRPNLEPVTEQNLAEFSEFLHRHLNSDMSAADWQGRLRTDWPGEHPNHGFLLRDGSAVVGGIGAYYAERRIAGQLEKICNITSWCVLEDYRQQSMRLAMAVVGQPGYHFTDFSPTKVVAGTLKFFKFQPLDERQVVALNLPWPVPWGARVLHRAEDIEAALQGEALQIYRDHKDFSWLRHVLVGTSGAWCHVIYKRRVLKRMSSAAILHLSDRRVFAAGWRPLSAHLLGHGFISTQIELRLLERRPWPSLLRTGFNPKLYLSATLRPEQIDRLYSEAMALDI